MPDFMKNSFRVVGGEPAPSMISWQVAILYGGMQFCGGTILDSCTVLSAKHCEIGDLGLDNLIIRAGSLKKRFGGQVCLLGWTKMHDVFKSLLPRYFLKDIYVK